MAGRAVRAGAGVEATAEIGPRIVARMGWSSLKSRVGFLVSEPLAGCAEVAKAIISASHAPMCRSR